MNPDDVIARLRKNLELYHQLLAVVQAEGEALRKEDDFSAFQYCQARKQLLPQLNESLEKLRDYRLEWQRLSVAERSKYPELGACLRSSQDMVMKIIVQDRENEQGLLRRGLLPPKAVPSVNRQRPHFVADMYRRGGAR